MISTKEAILKFKLEYDKLDSNDYPKFEFPHILMFLNKAQNRIIKQLYSGITATRDGVDSSQLRRDQLSSITEGAEPLQTLTQVDSTTWTYDLTTTAKPYLHFLSGRALATQGPCKDISLSMLSYSFNDLEDVVKDPNRKPSLDWQEVPAFFANNKIYLKTDGTFSLTQGTIKYLREPNPFDLVGYTTVDNTPSVNSDSDLPDFLVDDIVSEAVALAKGAIEGEGYQIAKQEANQNNV